MNSFIIKQAHLIDPSQNLDGMMDILVENGLITKIASDIPAQAGIEVIDVKGLMLLPGLVDMHVHLRDPGLTYKEDIASGCRAAAAGGVTSMACMPNTKPTCDTAQTVEYIVQTATGADAKVYPIAAITMEISGQTPTDIAALKQAGAVGLSDDGKPVKNYRFMLDTLRAAKELGLCVTCHAEDLDITGDGIMHLGEVSKALGVPGIDRAAEDSDTAGLIALAAASDTAVHIAHVSTAGSVALIRDAKRRGVNVTCETGPHYFTLTHEAVRAKDADYRMAPPLREDHDRQAVIEGIVDGTIDCIATDHAPHAPSEKADFLKAPNGVVGLETSLAVSYTNLVKTGLVSMSRLIELMSRRPAEILGLNAGALRPGMPADMVLFDPAQSWIVEPEQFHSKSRNSCFKGMELIGKVQATWVDGKQVFGSVNKA